MQCGHAPHYDIDLYILPEKFRAVIVAAFCFLQNDVHMEYVTNFRCILVAVAFPSGINALSGEVIEHGHSGIPKEIVAGGGNESGRIVLCDSFQHLQAGIVSLDFPTQIVQPKTSLARKI